MKKHALKLLTISLVVLSNYMALAQKKEGETPRVARFITVGFRPVELLNDRRQFYEIELGYEQFISKKTSLIGGLTYGTGKVNIKGVQGEILSSYKQKNYSLYTGIRSRLITTKKLSIFGELQGGIRKYVSDELYNTSGTKGFVGLGVGVEYYFSDFLTGTAGILNRYSNSFGLESSLNFGLKFRLGKKK